MESQSLSFREHKLRCQHPDCGNDEREYDCKSSLAAHLRESHPLSFTSTCNLGHSSLPVMPDSDVFTRLQHKWAQLEHSFTDMNRESEEEFVLHDGPPYANGHLHLGHALNKVLKDALCKWQRLLGKKCTLVPGWDCHGLPVELAVCKRVGATEASKLSMQELRRLCKEYASSWVDVQAEELRAMGVLASYQQKYLTMSAAYEAATLRMFGQFVGRGLVHRMLKTVPWCVGCHTSLATAEMEYEQKQSPAVLVSFPLVGANSDELCARLGKVTSLSLCVYTTTPWTLPLNRAVAVRPRLNYRVLNAGVLGWLVVAEALLESVSAQLGLDSRESEVTYQVRAEALAECQALHPWESDRRVPVVLDVLVKADKGTGCVHLAPGCGPEDYVAGLVHGLEVYSPVSANGYYTADAPNGLSGVPVSAGNAVVKKALQTAGRLLHWGQVTHDYPHCWRCHEPLMFRATEQYFCDLAKSGLADAAASEVENVRFYPERVSETSAAKLRRYVCGRTDWCLSRSRAWGVPVPACVCSACGHLELSKELADAAASHVEDVGVVGWGSTTPAALLGRGCSKCGEVETLAWETDVLDVWFDSGVSSVAVLGGRTADLYLEGDDQYRGWFQSSMFASMVLQNRAPTRSFATHSFVVDAKGEKMSKSKGNTVAPLELHTCYPNVLKRHNPDVLRLWALSADYTTSVKMSEAVVKSAASQCTKFRTTFRFLLQNLADFSRDDAVPLESLEVLDKFALLALERMLNNVEKAYTALDTGAVVEALDVFCREDLSKTYFSASKRSLYFLKDSDGRRRSCQTALFSVLQGLLTTLAPVTSFLCEEVWEQVPHHLKWEDVHSVHLLKLPDFGCMRSMLSGAPHLSQLSNYLECLRRLVTSAVDSACRHGTLDCAEQAHVTVLDSHAVDALATLSRNNFASFLQQFLVVSECSVTCAVCRVCSGSGLLLTDVCPLCDGDPLFATETTLEPSSLQMTAAWSASVENVRRTTRNKCQRCWRYDVQSCANGSDDLTTALSGDLCDTCAQVVSLDTVVQLMQQQCTLCGKHGHMDAECHFKKRRKHASQALAGA